MTQPFFPCTISAQSQNNEFLTIKTVVRKTHQNNGHTGSSCLDKAVLAQGGGGIQGSELSKAVSVPQSNVVADITHNRLCDIPQGCFFFTGPWTVTRSSLCVLRRAAVF